MKGLLKVRFYRVAHPALASSSQTSHQAIRAPASRQSRPKKRICPSCSRSTSENTRRQSPGARNGSKPSNTSTMANASQNSSANEKATQRGAVLPRMALKNSDDGSTTITSDLPVKLDL